MNRKTDDTNNDTSTEAHAAKFRPDDRFRGGVVEAETGDVVDENDDTEGNAITSKH